MVDENKGNLSEKIEEAVEIAENVVRQPFVKKFARLGFYAKGFLFAVIGILAILVAIGVKGGEITAANGALAGIAQVPFGRIILIIFVVGAVSHGIWNILRGAADVDNAGTNWQGIGKRIVSAGIGIFYLFLAWTALNLIIDSQPAYADNAIQKTLTETLLALPLGAVLVAIIGLIVIGVGFQQGYSGISGKFKKDFMLDKAEDNHKVIITILGIFGFTAQALIFALIGYYFVWAALDYDANEVVGMDGALLVLAQSYYGKTLLFITATGLVCHGVLSLYESKYRRIY